MSEKFVLMDFRSCWARSDPPFFGHIFQGLLFMVILSMQLLRCKKNHSSFYSSRSTPWGFRADFVEKVEYFLTTVFCSLGASTGPKNQLHVKIQYLFNKIIKDYV